MRRVLSLATLTLAAVAWTPASAAMVRWFHSPSGNIQCEVAAAGAQGTHALCQTTTPPRRVVLKANGQSRICRGNLCLGDGPENAFTLRYGRSVSVGPFRCTSSTAGMKCVVTRTGHGFFISRQKLNVF